MERKILIVDDEQETRELLSIELEKEGYAVAVAKNEEECLEKIKQEKTDLVLLDLMLSGGVSGIAVLEEIKKAEPLVEVIIITGDASITTALESIKKGAYDYVTKPFNFDKLKEKIEKCLVKKRLTEESSRKRVLVIDDDVQTTGLIREILTEENFEVYITNDGNTGIEKARELLPDLITLDIVLRGMGGWDVCEALKKDKRTADIPIIIVSGIMIRTKDEVKSFELGVDDFIIKPFDINALLKRIKAIIRKTEEIKILKDESHVFEIAKAVSSLMNTDELLQRILKSAVEISKSDGGTIMIYDDKADEFEIKTSYGDFKENVVGKKIKKGERVVGAAAREKKPIIIHGDLKDNPRFRQLEQYNGTISGMVIPMIVKEKVIGCITLKRTKNEKVFSVHESNLLSIFASQAALFIENASLYEQLKKHNR